MKSCREYEPSSDGGLSPSAGGGSKGPDNSVVFRTLYLLLLTSRTGNWEFSSTCGDPVIRLSMALRLRLNINPQPGVVLILKLQIPRCFLLLRSTPAASVRVCGELRQIQRRLSAALRRSTCCLRGSVWTFGKCTALRVCLSDDRRL